MRKIFQVASLLLLAFLLPRPTEAALYKILWPAHELLPERRAFTAECVKADAGTVRALLVGVDKYMAMPGAELRGSVNDANLLAAALKRYQASVMLVSNATRATLVDNLTSLAHDSRCGDTVVLYLAGHAFSIADSGLYIALSDITDDLQIENVSAYPLFSIPGSPAQREGRRIPGALDSNELLDYFDRLRENGVNIVFIADVAHANRFAARMGNDFASWHALRTGPGSDGSDQSAKGAFFGIYSGAEDVETTLPPGDSKGAVHGVLSWAVASALGEIGNSAFSTFSEKIIAVWERTVANLKLDKTQLDPVFESSHPYRSPFATGLPTANGTGESRLRNVDSRRIEVTAPALQRGLARVGLGFVLIQGRIMSSTPPKAISANQILGEVYKDGTFRIRLPVSQGENSVLLTAWWSDTDFVPSFPFTVVAQNGENIVQEGRRYALLIGNQSYKDPEFQHLDTPIADTHALAKLLEQHYGFSTTAMIGDQPISLVLDDAARERMLKVLSQLRPVLKPGDSLLLYYGGHGVYEKETDRAYWLPVDAARDAPEDWVSDADISAALARLSARHILVVADSCYAGAFRHRGVEPAAATMSRVQFLDEVNLRQSRNFLSSGANEPVADGGGNGHSVFARALLNGLSQEKTPFTAGELFGKYIQPVVGGNSKQIPQYFPMKDGHEGGEFVFVPQRPN